MIMLLKMRYKATFGIDCGVSVGFTKVPHYEKVTRIIYADNPQDAYKRAMGVAEELADNYLSNPESNLTTVRLMLLKSRGREVPFDVSEAVVKRGMLEHLLSLFPKGVYSNEN
ncbi:hypothetical protein D6829_01500 [Candidatus Pacearchaeota archaeon]|nr:MAG: hypothetical protein D6829_01500 [Candidatus Pacearchaeota archaeon]